MRELLKKAKSDLRFAKLGLSSDDEQDIQLAAFHVQQAAEKVLKQLLKECRVKYRKPIE